jgi:ribosomal protein S18 acetylase RimI-like enzyme
MIRNATPGDAAMAVPLILLAIGDLAFVLTGTPDLHETAAILGGFFKREANRLSYQNALVLEEDGTVVGLAILYDGAAARELDLPIERAAGQKSGDPQYSIPTEPEKSEFYLDTLAVIPRCQGKGYGRKLIEAGCDRARRLGHLRIALLVEVDTPAAKRLYERLGFRSLNSKREYIRPVSRLDL